MDLNIPHMEKRTSVLLLLIISLNRTLLETIPTLYELDTPVSMWV